MMRNWRWFISKRLREAVEDRKQIIKLLAAQRDLIKSGKIDELEHALSELDEQCRGPIKKAALLDARKNALDTADRVLIPYPDAGWRDWVEMFLVVAALVLAFRTFFFQPFKIPTGSMQPTLYGITVENLMDQDTENVTGRVEEGVFIVKSVEEGKEVDDFFLRTDKKLASLQEHTVTFTDGQKVTISKILVSNRKDDKNATILVCNRAKLEPSMKTKSVENQPFTISFEKWPGKLGYAIEKLRGYTYHSMKAEGNWRLVEIQDPKRIVPFISKQVLTFSDTDTGETINRTAWFPPLDSQQKPVLSEYTDFNKEYKTGDYIYRIRVKTGDHLFVNRMTYNFRNPRRGDIAVFQIRRDFVSRPPPIYTNIITGKLRCAVPLQKTFYIKRLVALEAENVAIGKDRHLTINGKRLSSTNPGFEFVYSRSNGEQKDPKPELNSMYSGHSASSKNSSINNLFESGSYLVPSGYYLMMGDNTYSSADSRFWGGIQKEKVIGHSSFVYWPPLSPRFGWSHR